MSDLVIYKYPFVVPEVSVPLGQIVLVAAQSPSDLYPTVWIEQAHDQRETHPLVLLCTGHPIDEHLTHVGSAVCADGSLVWHVYEDQS